MRSARFAYLLVLAFLTLGLLSAIAAAAPSDSKELLLSQPFSTGVVQKGALPAPRAGIEAAWPGPDGLGYVGQVVAYNWVEISATGTPVAGLGDDDYDGPFPIGFSFSFYGTNWADFYVNSNGFLSFGSGSAVYTNQCPLPDDTMPNNLIALMWDDLDARPTSAVVYYQTFASCPVGGGPCLVVQYEDFCHFTGSLVCTPAGTWEAILYEGGGVLVQFQDVGVEGGSGSTTGIEGAAASADYGLTYACNTPGSITAGLAIRFSIPVLWTKWVDGVAWAPGLTVTVETSDTVEVVDVLEIAPAVAPTTPVALLGQAVDGPVKPSATLRGQPHAILPGTAQAGQVLETFANTWMSSTIGLVMSSTIGLVYNPGLDLVRYAHEGDDEGVGLPTVFDVGYPTPHPVLAAITLSAVNPGWPAILNNRDGAGYDATTGTYFLTDYNGDLNLRDDNVVEVDAAGAILNAWETDGAGNDSYDGSAVNQIVDIAVVPGSPARYFATAAYDGSTVYEIELVRAGVFASASWGTVTTCTVAGLADNAGIDYDAVHGVLYHSDYDSSNIVVTDLECNVVDSFTCPSAAGFNTGVTYVEGKAPPEVWVTDYESNSTTRCEAVAAGQAYQLTEAWDPGHLALLDVQASGGEVVTGSGSLVWSGTVVTPTTVTLTKLFHVEPCTWTQTVLEEELLLDGVLVGQRPVTVTKLAPVLALDSVYEPGVMPGEVVTFTLVYSNSGGYENGVWIRNEFPAEAPFASSLPPPDTADPAGLWAEWQLGDLAQGAQGSIEVQVDIADGLAAGTLITITDWLYDHTGQPAAETTITFQVRAAIYLPIVTKQY
jgi:hypothetical protein